MKQKDVFNKIGEIIQELADQYEYLQTVKDNLNDLELELFVANAHFLTDHIEILSKLNLQKGTSQPSTEKPEPAFEQKYFEPVVQQMKYAVIVPESKTSNLQSNQAEPEKPGKIAPEEQPAPKINIGSDILFESHNIVREEPETIRHELILDETYYQEEEEDMLNENELAEDTKKGETNAEVLTINQKISSQLADKVSDKTEQAALKPIGDIKLAITLNDKLLYVKDLFNGYNLAYSEAIEILNRFNTFEEATRFLKTNYVTKNNWESKSATAEKFYEILKRRYA
jgi:hypothetical protein